MWWLCLFSLNIYCQKFVILQRIGEPTRKRNVNIVEQEDCIAYLVATHNERAGRLWFQSLFSSSSPTLFNLQRICHSWAVPRCCFQIAKWHIVQYIDGKPMNKSSWYSAEAKLFSRKLTTALSGQKLAQRNWHQPLSWRIPDYAARLQCRLQCCSVFFSRERHNQKYIKFIKWTISIASNVETKFWCFKYGQLNDANRNFSAAVDFTFIIHILTFQRNFIFNGNESSIERDRRMSGELHSIFSASPGEQWTITWILESTRVGAEL